LAALSVTEPILVADDLRVDVEGAPACDGLGFRTTGERVLVLGAPRALFEAATSIAPLARGSLVVRGTPAKHATERGVIAGVASDSPMPPSWTVTEYVRWSARLAGVPAAEAISSAEAAIAKLKLDPLAKTPLSRVVPHARRATAVAAALATFAEVIALDDPLGGLPDEVARTYAEVLVGALEERAWVVFAPRLPLASPLAMAADEAIVASATRVDAQGPPAEIAAATRRFVGRATGRLEAIAPALSARGARVEQRGAHVLFDLGREMTTSELFAICAGVDVAIVELVPVARALF
jgi:ABC-type multidrug transport system ATPase subunit